MFKKLRAPGALLIGAMALAGCANDGILGGSHFSTASVSETPKVDPACVMLTSQIETLRKDGIADKIEKAAAKKYKMMVADLIKADQLNKANAEFQMKCSTITPKAAMTSASLAPSAPAAKAALSADTSTH
jgi:PBP1b-binding outer membrane lipoprotein LpoB